MAFNYNGNAPIIIGIDHGYGNIKTAHHCFQTGVLSFDQEPTFKNNLLVYNDRYYIIGEDHKEFAANKMVDMDYYILTLAAIAFELETRDLREASVYVAAGLPLTWLTSQKDSFREYLLQNQSVDFEFRGASYHVEFVGADIFPQGFAAVVDKLHAFSGVNMLADIGNGTMNIMYINNCLPQQQRRFTEKFGTYQCMIAVREELMRRYGSTADDLIIEEVLRYGDAEISPRYLAAIQETATEYVASVFRKLREHGYDPELMRLFVVGGGSCLVKHFGKYDAGQVLILENICATAQGYEYLAEARLRKAGGVA